MFSLAFGQQTSTPTTPPRTDERLALCNVGSLPPDIQRHLKEDFGSWRVQEPTDLSVLARERWEAEKPLACPGIANGQFENTKAASYAVLLVPKGHADAGYRFLVFSPKGGQLSYDISVVEHSDGGEASYYFIHKVPVSKFFGQASRRKFGAHTSDCILFLGSGKKGYEADVYFWSNGSYQHQPVDY
jgi:hypothetical protein